MVLEVALLLDEVSDEAAEPRTVFAATHTCLRALAEREPVVIAVDDVQWIDPPSAAALSYAIRRLADSHVSILAARRVEQATTERSDFENALEHRHGQGLQRVEVGPVSADVLHAAILDRLGLAYPHSIVERIHQASGGNPFYALELGRALSRRSGETRSTRYGALPVPDTLQGLVQERLDGAAGAEVQDVLGRGGRAGKSDTLARVEATAPGGERSTRRCWRACCLADEVRLRFAHPLLASAAYGCARTRAPA